MPSNENPYQPPNDSDDAPATAASSNSAVHFAGSLTVTDAYEAVNFAKTRFAMFASRSGVTFLTIFLLLATAFAANEFFHDEDFFVPFIGVIVLDIVVVVASIAHSRALRARAEQLYRERKGLYAPTKGHVDGTRIQSMADAAEATLTWDAFCGYRNSERVAILYQHFPNNYVIFARTKFHDEKDWQRFLDIVSENLPAR